MDPFFSEWGLQKSRDDAMISSCPNSTADQIAELGIYPAVDPLDSTSRLLDPEYISLEHYKTTRATQKLLQDYKSLQVETPLRSHKQ